MACWAFLFALVSVNMITLSCGFSFSRIPLARANLLSIYPTHIIPTRKVELLYVPSPLTQRLSDHARSIVDDHHFVSRLSDCGYPVHTLEIPPSECTSQSVQSCLSEALVHLQTSQTQIVLLATELSCLNILQVVSAGHAKIANISNQIQGIVLIDPPPLHSIQTEYSRRRILQRFTFPDSLVFPALFPKGGSTTEAASVVTDHTVLTDCVTTGTTTTTGTDTAPTTPVTPSITEEELEYYEELIRRQNAGGSLRSVMQLHPPRRSKLRRFLDTLTRRNTPHNPHSDAHIGAQAKEELKLSPAEQHERVLIALQSGILTTKELLGGDVLAHMSSVKEHVGRRGVLIVGTSSTSSISSSCNSLGTYTVTRESDDTKHENGDISTNMQSDHDNSVDSTTNSTIEYDEAALFSEADDWGPASMDETASLYSAYPVQYVPPHTPSLSAVQPVTYTDECEWSAEDVHVNNEVARLVDIFVRNLAL